MLTLAFFIATFSQLSSSAIAQFFYRGIALALLPFLAILLWLITRIIFWLHPSDTTKMLKQIYNIDLFFFLATALILFILPWLPPALALLVAGLCLGTIIYVFGLSKISCAF